MDEDEHAANGEITAQFYALRGELIQINDNLRDEGYKRDQRIAHAEKNSERLRRIAVAAIVVGFLGVFVGAIGWYQATTAHDALDKANAAIAASKQIEASITSNEHGSPRWASCEQFNKQQTQAIQGDFERTLATVAAIGVAPTPTDKTKTEIYRAVVKAHPLRDCSPAGIATYLKNP